MTVLEAPEPSSILDPLAAEFVSGKVAHVPAVKLFSVSGLGVSQLYVDATSTSSRATELLPPSSCVSDSASSSV